MKWYKISQDYIGEHSAPNRENGAPLYDITSNGIYPKDFYTGRSHEYGDQSGLIVQYHNKPNANVKIYRAVPYSPGKDELLHKIESWKELWMSRHTIPADVPEQISKGEEHSYYDRLWDYEQEVRSRQEEEVQRIEINTGDWVSLNRSYAKEHGASNLNNQYRIISKTVKAKCLWTEGNGFEEWGYSC